MCVWLRGYRLSTLYSVLAGDDVIYAKAYSQSTCAKRYLISSQMNMGWIEQRMCVY